jgi:hypothetical protein
VADLRNRLERPGNPPPHNPSAWILSVAKRFKQADPDCTGVGARALSLFLRGGRLLLLARTQAEAA